MREGVRRGALCPDCQSPKAQIESDCCAKVAPPSIGPKVEHIFDGMRGLSSSSLVLARRTSQEIKSEMRLAVILAGLLAVITSAVRAETFEAGGGARTYSV